MRRAAIALLVTLAAALAGCGDKKAPSPSLSAEAPAGGSAAPTGSTVPAGSSAADAPAEAPPPPPSGPLFVDLSGTAHLPPPIPEGASRLASIAIRTDVFAKPSLQSARVGSLRAGAVVETEGDVAGTAGCSGGWRKIKPYGFVCVGPEATLDMNHPIVRAATRRPDITQKLPYMYGIVTRGGPVYASIPTAEDLKQHEKSLSKHLAKWEKDKESGATYGLDVWMKWKTTPSPPALEALEQKLTDADIPWFLKDGGRAPDLSGLAKTQDVKIGQVDRRNGVAFVETFLHEGRRYNVSTDLRVMPADRFRPIRGSDFHGYEIGKDIEFPFALVRRPGAKRFVWSDDKKKLVADGEVAWRSAVQLTGKQKMVGGVLHYEMKDGGYIDDRHAGRVDPAKKMPAWGKNGEKWIDINITKQVLVAYEGTKAVFATLVSSGESGLDDPETSKATKRGIFRIHTKYVTVTMDSNVVGEEFELRDVPYVQYFEDGYALHGAYWHDRFGQPKSHGCVNLAPEDARRLFHWTEPQVPYGWHGAARSLTGTVVFIHP